MGCSWGQLLTEVMSDPQGSSSGQNTLTSIAHTMRWFSCYPQQCRPHLHGSTVSTTFDAVMFFYVPRQVHYVDVLRIDVLCIQASHVYVHHHMTNHPWSPTHCPPSALHSTAAKLKRTPSIHSLHTSTPFIQLQLQFTENT